MGGAWRLPDIDADDGDENMYVSLLPMMHYCNSGLGHRQVAVGANLSKIARWQKSASHEEYNNN